jgi:hypothetical protein
MLALHLLQNIRSLFWVCIEAMDFAHRIFLTDFLAKEKTPLLVYGYNSSVCTRYVILICFNWNTFGTFCMKSFGDIRFCLLGCKRKGFPSKKLVNFCDTTWHHILERSTFQKMFSGYVSKYGWDIGVCVQVMKASALKLCRGSFRPLNCCSLYLCVSDMSVRFLTTANCTLGSILCFAFVWPP